MKELIKSTVLYLFENDLLKNMYMDIDVLTENILTTLKAQSKYNCKHVNNTPYYGREGDYWGKRCDDCGEELE
jgi:hypothetical protein